MPEFSVAVEKARQRRVARADAKAARIEWFIDQVSNTVNLSMTQRVRTATEFLRSRVVKNISIPVTKATSRKTGRVVVLERSKPGEFPRADTTQLMKTIFKKVKSTKSFAEGYVGTPLDYGLILETRMNRSFLVRTLREESTRIRRILTGPIRGGRGTSFGYERM